MITPQTLINGIKAYTDSNSLDEELIKKAYVFALNCHGTQIRDSGDPYFTHPLEVASMLIDLKMDAKTIIAALLHDTVEDTNVTITEIAKEFGEDTARIVDGVTKLSKFEAAPIAEKQAENFKKLLMSSASDIKILIIKLADRLHNMRTLKYREKKKRQRTAKETIEIYAPLAERVGITAIKDELQDIAFCELYPDIYNSINSRLKDLYEKSAHIIDTIASKLNELVDDETNGIEPLITGRMKTPFSIWRKMGKRNISFEQLSDVMAFRIIVQTVPQCYEVLGVVHRNFLVIPGRFRDYVSTPKNNGYQSLHTSVIGPFSKRIEIQIRTKEMHSVSEYGLASHWNYKQTGDGKKKSKDNYKWINSLVDVLNATSGMDEFVANSKTEMQEEQIFCITPNGKIISLPKGGCAIDFAYAIHAEVGNHAVSAVINGVSVPLKTVLENGDQVEVITDPTQIPNRSWTNYAATIKAKTCIQAFFNSINAEKNIIFGRSILEEYFKARNINVSEADYQNLAQSLGYNNTNILFQSVGTSEITIQEVFYAYNSTKSSKGGKNQKDVYLPISGIPADVPLLPVNCCTPIPGDRIVGLIFDGHGMEIHCENCCILKQQVVDGMTTHLVDLTWRNSKTTRKNKYPAKLSITVNRAPGHLLKIVSILEETRASLINFRVMENFENFSNILIEAEVSDISHLNSVRSTLRGCEFITNIERNFWV